LVWPITGSIAARRLLGVYRTGSDYDFADHPESFVGDF
jgi:hypothetical protein